MGTSTLWLCYFPNCFTHHLCGNTNNKCIFSPKQHQTTISLPLTYFHLFASKTNTTTTTTRRSRRLKTDDEIRSDIRQFLDEVGLPDGHIPSTKELLSHGRNDLANIVRRRGHKKIQDLLTSLCGNVNSLETGKGLDERSDAANDIEVLLTGQNEKVDGSDDGTTVSTEFLQGDSSGSMYADSTPSLDECTSAPVESSDISFVEDGLGELKYHSEEVNNVAEAYFHPTEVTTVDNDLGSSSEGLYPNFDSQSSMPTEISGESSFETTQYGNSECDDALLGKMVGDITFPLTVPSTENHSITSYSDPDVDNREKEFNCLEPSVDLSVEQKDWGALESLDDYNNNITDDVPTTSGSEFSENKIDSISSSANVSDINLDTSFNLSMEEKVANFIQNGDLDPVEGAHPPKENNAMAHNGNSLTSNQVVPSGKLDQPLCIYRDDHMLHEDPMTHFDKDLDAEGSNVQNQSEINHLKFMLKELELSRLKEQIEKEKHALSVLQTKAEEEISKARKLISEKDAELHEAEESLSGLKEVLVEFCGDGDVVEVAGSFNGWHHPIKMDPQPLTSVIDHDGSRKSRFWSAVLWLYPGVYEIKFVVDGDWRTDPQRESVARGHICNNILRVDR
ncbi:protein PTST homolog 3, chloroplastic isoform X2 [Medicago truncatula]|uniref:protein PTST homolog 3, chloroplastic isoform X2 n=1 Tax=Medicago truncatula TaxID=3880 RepID=UPI000D2F1870|nr:protein PTST homolog 3, chloroplastic isoform X2 [Medicago truncatula]